jgi:hypothetical protein
MRLGRIFVFSIPFVVLLCAAAAVQAGESAKKTPEKPAAPKPAPKKYLVEIYSIPLPCITPAFYPQPAPTAASATSATEPSATSATEPPAASSNGPSAPSATKPSAASANEPPAASPTEPSATCPDSQLPVASSVTAPDIVKVVSVDSSYASYDFEAVDSDKIAIYKKNTPPDPKKPDPVIAKIEKAIATSAADPSLRYIQVMHVPKGAAKEAISWINAVSAGSISATPIEGDNVSILLQSKTVPANALLEFLKQHIARMEQLPTPPTQRLFHLNANEVVKVFSSSGDAGGEKSGSEKADSDKPSADKTSAKGSKKVSPQAASSSASEGAKKSSDASDDKADSADQASANQDDSDGSTQKPAAPINESAPKPPAMKAVNDTLVYFNDDGSDRGIFERNRLMAVLDLPRPEVLLNLWALQASSRDYRVTNSEAEAIRTAVTEHNQRLQDAIDDGWAFLSEKMAYTPAPGQAAFFATKFYNYITQKFALNPYSKPGADFDRIEKIREGWGWCSPTTYCLGFTHAFEPLRPTFTNILLAIIAANDPEDIAQQTIDHMEGDCPPAPTQPFETPCPTRAPTLSTAADEGEVNGFQQCISDRTREIQTAIAENAAEDCELADRLTLASQVLASDQSQPERLQLSCFKKQARISFQGWPEDPPSSVVHHQQTTRVGLLRAAVADFLFNYKWSIQYPHSFVPYDLSQSAQELNAELNPLILAFNRDVAAFTQALQTEMECKYRSAPHPSWFGKAGDETFLNDGMIAVRGISGVESIVDTVTQSYFDATKPPSLTDLVSAVSDAQKNTPGVLKANLTANEAAVLLGALNSVKPAEARIGRELKLDITPHALAGASSAELDVKLTAEEAGSPTLYSASKSSDDTLSRVGTHDTTTKVRVESLKLFEVSAFSATLQRPRSKFPLLPPFFEVPYFGTFIGYPIRGARVYHRSTAIVSAVIVPTAADLAYGIDFTDDRVCHPTGSSASQPSGNTTPDISYGYTCSAAASPNDFPDLPLRNFHKAMVQCLATQQQTSETGTQATDLAKLQGSPVNCGTLKFDTVPPSQ